MQTIIRISSTLKVIEKCWEKAEGELQALIEKKHPDLDEEFITRLFYGEFAFLVYEASANGEIRQAFLSDLKIAFPNLAYSPQLESLPSGLIADMSLHKRDVEKFTGGDFGLTIIRPIIKMSRHSYGKTVLKKDEYCCGLLCQAKIKRRNGKWGKLSNKQKDIFPDRMKYLGLLLYDYGDENRCHLNKFEWQLCQNASLEEVKKWLKSGIFPDKKFSGEIIRLLGNGRIGTDNPETIKKFIRPKTRPNLSIRIFWPLDKDPGKEIRIPLPQQVIQKPKQYVHIRRN
jgi:hypothetical protein